MWLGEKGGGGTWAKSKNSKSKNRIHHVLYMAEHVLRNLAAIAVALLVWQTKHARLNLHTIRFTCLIDCERHYFIPFPEFHKITRYLFINSFFFYLNKL